MKGDQYTVLVPFHSKEDAMEYKEFDVTFPLTGKVAAVTGGASGIGFVIAEMFARKGADLFLIDRSDSIDKTALDLKKQYGIKAHGHCQDLSEPGCAAPAADLCMKHFGRVDILVNNAGISFLEDVENLSEEYWDKTLEVNLKVPFLLSQVFAKKMIAQGGGKIINMASQAAVVALDKHAAYCASKAGIVSLTKVCALEWGEYNINVNCISPTVILTEMGRNYWKGEIGEAMKKKIPIGRFGYPEEVAAACAFLASDAANLITGENLILDGGYSIK